MRVNLYLRSILSTAVFALVLYAVFLTAGRWDWIELWIFLGAYLLLTTAWALYLKLKNPGLLKERQTAFKRGKKWDRILMSIYGIFALIFLFTAALDAGRFENFNIPIFIKILAFMGILGVYVLAVWCGAANTYMSSSVRIQKDRGHQVIQSGPYRFVRHPLYISNIVFFPFLALFLGSLWALIPAAVIMTLFVIRTSLEDSTLKKELDGYHEYTQRVKYRLLPYIW